MKAIFISTCFINWWYVYHIIIFKTTIIKKLYNIEQWLYQQVNSTFGKLCENMSGRRKAVFVTNERKLSQSLSSPYHSSSMLINPNLVQTLFFPKSLCLNKPLIPGVFVLDLAKADGEHSTQKRRKHR